MILEHLKHLKPYRVLSPRLALALDFLGSADLLAIQAGDHPLDGSKVFVRVMEYYTRQIGDCGWEAHRKYIDIHCMALGCERMGFAPLHKMKVTTEYSDQNDNIAFDGDGIHFDLQEKMVAIFWPHDVHRPCITIGASAKVKKVLIKVAMD